LVISGAINPLEHDVFQMLFGMVMTVLIALEFKHSIIRVALPCARLARRVEYAPQRMDGSLRKARG
jgi:hypothetical protein